jgi:hypothetical protein
VLSSAWGGGALVASVLVAARSLAHPCRTPPPLAHPRFSRCPPARPRPPLAGLQGVLALTDNAAEDGGTIVVPGFHRLVTMVY